MITKWILMRVRPLRPFRSHFLTVDEMNRLGENGQLTYREIKQMVITASHAAAVSNRS